MHSLRLDDQSETAAHHAVAVTTAKARLHPRHTFVWHALHQADVEADLVPFDDLRATRERERQCERERERDRGRFEFRARRAVPWIWKKGRPT